LYFRYQNGNRDDWRAAFAFIQQHKRAADLVVAADQQIADYYLQTETLAWDRYDPTAFSAKGRRIWFVEDMNTEAVQPHLFAWIKQHAQQVADLDVHVQARNFKMRVYLYDPIQPVVMP
jgi:hypothetical protein